MRQRKTPKKRFTRALIYAILPTIALAFVYFLMHEEIRTTVSPLAYPVVDQYAFAVASVTATFTLIPAYYLRYQDISETLAVAITMIWGLYFGLEDIIVYVLFGQQIPDKLPWLYDSTTIGWAAQTLGHETVTGAFLIGFVVATGVAVFYIDYRLYRTEAEAFSTQI